MSDFYRNGRKGHEGTQTFSKQSKGVSKGLEGIVTLQPEFPELYQRLSAQISVISGKVLILTSDHRITRSLGFASSAPSAFSAVKEVFVQ